MNFWLQENSCLRHPHDDMARPGDLTSSAGLVGWRFPYPWLMSLLLAALRSVAYIRPAPGVLMSKVVKKSRLS